MKIEDMPLEPEELKGKDLVITSLPDEEAAESMEGLKNALEKDEPYITKNIRPEHLRKLMTPKRRELTEFVKEERPSSISETAEELDRGLREVDQDLKLLERMGILYFEKEGRARKPVIPFENIDIQYRYLRKRDKGENMVEA
ncbi:MAG: hypothetical protein ABEK16_04155 [Candidatus Nanohalobium sp.]